MKFAQMGDTFFMNVNVDNTPFSLVNIYAHNDKNNRNTFFTNIKQLLSQKSEGLKIIEGDMNETLENRDRLNKTGNTVKMVNSLKSLIKTHKLVDIWRLKNDDKTQYTWRRKNGYEKSRIDFWLIDENLVPLILSSDIRPVNISYTDHLAISLKVIKPNKRGPGYWKLNNYYLEDQNYIKLINIVIDKCIHKYDNVSHQTLWELCKIDIKEESIKFAKIKHKETVNKTIALEKQLASLYEVYDRSNNNQTINNEIKLIEQELQDIYNLKAKGAQIRARVQFIDEGEKNTKYFLNLEKLNQTRKIMNRLNVNGKYFSDIQDILREETSFYKLLYKSEGIDTNLSEL